MKAKQKQTHKTKGSLHRLRDEALRAISIRLIYLGWDAVRIGKRLNVHPQTVRECVNTVEFQVDFAKYQQERLAITDRRVNHLLDLAVLTLTRHFRHHDPWVRADAIDKCLRLHGKYIARIDVSGRLEHAGGSPASPAQLDDMTPQERELTRSYLQAMRDMRQPKMIPGRLTTINAEPSSNGHGNENGAS